MVSLNGLIGESPGLEAVRKQVQQLLGRHSGTRRLPPVLILGETGTGKGLLARAFHDEGPRKGGAFIAVNCAAIPETLLEAELFGYERGAFTDAHQAKAGLFQSAHRGTLFLDEIGLLPQNLQAKLLTALEDRAVRRLGSVRPEPVDVWIISATSEDLMAGVHRRGFREDLYHRLAVVTLRLPPLRARGQDILRLAEHFLALTCSEYGLAPKALTEDARAALMAYRWPGNVREVANVMERAALLVDGPRVTADRLELAIPRTHRASLPADHERTPRDAPVGMPLGQTVEEVERRHILEALHETNWNISRAASRLGVTRNILRYRVQKYGLQLPPTTKGLTEPTDGGRSAELTTGRGPVHVQWERRHVALLRVDLVTTGMNVFPAVGVALETVVEKIESFGGQVEEVSPSGLVAVFGLKPVEDAARRAAHAALAVQRIAARARGHSTGSANIQAGLHVGEVLIAQVGGAVRVDHAAKREAWRQLEIFMGGAEAGTVLVSEATRPFLERRFVLTPIAGGEGTTGTVCRLVGLEQTGLGLGERLTPFVARSYELGQLAQAFKRAQAGRGQVVAVVGEPGVGKSRLFWEFMESHRGRDSLILVSGAASYGREMPYLPIIDLLKGYFQIEPHDSAPKVRERVTERMLSLEPALRPMLSAVLALLDVPVDDAQWQELDPQQKRRKTLDAVKVLLLEQSRRQPIIAVLEDLHWIDSETQAALEILVESLPSHRVLLLVSYRPQYQHAWAGKTYYAQLRLDPLSPEDSHALLDRLVGHDEATAALKTVLIERTDGNPFFLEECVRTLVETGVLGGDRGVYRLARSTGEIRVPATVQAMLAARIDRLPPEDRKLLQTAAVIGKDVPFALLKTVADSPDESLRAGLIRLQRSEFLYETRLLPELEYAFKHVLSHEVAYADVLQDRQQVLHARIMVAIEQQYANRLTEQVDRLALHALRGEVWDKAVAYFRQAGAKAAQRSAYREAVACFEQALRALTHLPETRKTIEQGIDLRVDLRNSLFSLGEYRRVFDHLCEAKILAERIGDQGRLGWISAYTAHHLWQANDPDRAVESGLRALAISQTCGDFALQVVANLRLGQAYLSLGDFRRASECFQSNIESLEGDLMRERFGEAWLPSVLTRVWLVHVLVERGEFAEAIARGEEAARIAETVDQPLSRVGAYSGLGYLYLRKGDFDKAIHFLDRCRELFQAWNIGAFAHAIVSYLGYACVLSGRLTDGLLLLEQGIERSASLGALSGYVGYLANLSEAYGLANREDDAIRVANQALDFSRDHKRGPHDVWALRALGEVASHRDPPDTEKAEASYRQAMVLADELGMRPIVAHCHLGLGKLCGRVGKRREASEHLATAATMYAEMEMRFWLDQAEAEANSLRTTSAEDS